MVVNQFLLAIEFEQARFFMKIQMQFYEFCTANQIALTCSTNT